MSVLFVRLVVDRMSAQSFVLPEID